MKPIKFLAVLFSALLSLPALAQMDVASWTSKSEKISDGLYRIEMKGSIADGWHIYDMGPYDNGGPNPTIVIFEVGEGSELEGELIIEGKKKKVYDEMFKLEIGYYEGDVVFSQKIKVEGQATVKAVIEYMACNDMNCMPPTEEEFTFKIGEAAPAAAAAPTPVPAKVEESKTTTPSELKPATTTSDNAVKDAAGNKSLWGLIIEAILWGFAALLTPCVFPMVPMTVSYFLHGEGGAAKGRLRAALYGLFIVALYTLPIAIIILITRIAGGDAVTADIFNWLATHWLPNIIFFLVFMIFAASFFGAFEITMPSKLVNKSDSKADTKGLGGIFFLALTLVLVSFSCTGPIVGSVLIKSTSGEFWTPILTMFAFSVAFALPFTIFALFPSLLKNLPKSGGWLNTVKVVIAFIEVALGFKFLSTADQTYHWGLLDREVYLAIWITVFTLLGLYLMGKIKFAHDDDVKHISVGRLTLIIVVFSFVVYLIPGMWGAPLKALSGYLPPITTQDFVLGQYTSSHNSGDSKTISISSSTDLSLPANRKYSDFLHLPHNLDGFFDLKEAEEYAAKVGKPIFIDFTGHGCVNCREMEARVWSDPRVLEILRNDYVICALYADDKKVVPEEDWVTTEAGKVLKSLGKINSHFALKTYGVNAQPYYVLQGRNGNPLVEPRSYDLNVEAFIKFLESGKEAYTASR